MRDAELTIISNEECRSRSGKYDGNTVNMQGYVSDDQMCAESTGKGTCQGDSGGPLTVEYNGKHYLAGVNNYAYGCATPNLPGVFSNVISNSLKEWIDRTVADNGGADFCYGDD